MSKQAQIVRDIHRVMKNGCSGRAYQELSAIIANVVGLIGHRAWLDLMSHAGKPCGQPGCECHVIFGPLWDQLDAIREDWQKHNHIGDQP